jgi:hypothetical protein
MKITCYVRKTRPRHQVTAAESFCAGLKRHGLKGEISTKTAVPDHESDLILAWGMRQARTIRTRSKKDFLLAERAYFEDRHKWISLGYNGLNNRGEFYNRNSPDDRWKKHFDDGRLQPWNPEGQYILLTLQIKGDNSIRNFPVNYQKLANDLRKATDLPVLVKDHPVRRGTWGNIQTDGVFDGSIEEGVRKAAVTVTINSNSGVDSVLAGTPVVNFDHGSMVWELAMKDLTQLSNPPLPDRTQWAADLAYTQWLPEEIAAGDAWEHLKQRYE